MEVLRDMSMPLTNQDQTMENSTFKKLNPGELTHIATRGAFWNIGLAFANKGFTLVGQIVLAWILSPKDMGLASMAIAMAGIVAFMNASGVCDVLIQRGRFKEEAGQGLWLSLFLSFSTSLLIACLVPIASWMGRPELSKMLLILIFLPIADAFSPILSAALKSDLKFKYFAISSFFSGITYTIFAVIFAWMGLGAYSLILPVIPRALVNWISMIPRTGLPHFEKPQVHLIKKLIRPALSISLTGFLYAMQQQAPIFLVGLITNFTVTGHFSWGWQVASQAVFLLAINLRQVLMPTLSKISHDPIRQASAMFRAIRAITSLLTIACGLQALLAQPILDEFFPERWHPAGPVIVWISIGLIFQGIYVCLSSWLNAAGRYKDLLFVTILPVLLSSGLTYWGAKINGAEGAAIGSALGLFLSSSISLTRVPLVVFKDQALRLVLPLLISGTFFEIFYLLEHWHQNFIRSLICSIFFVFVSLAVSWHWSQEMFRNILNNILKNRIGENDFSAVKSIGYKNPVPNFFIIGAPKCGTTALSEFLKNNPKIFISSPKEPEYFSFDLSKSLKMSQKTYLSLFMNADPLIHKAIGEGSTAYLFSKCAVSEILKFNPDAKFILMLRNPVDLVRSFHAQMVFQGIETVQDFRKAWKLELERKKGNHIPALCYDINSLMYSEWGKLGEQVERLYSQVAEDRIKTIIFDDFAVNPKKVYEEVLEFLGVPSDGRSEFPRINESKKVIIPFLQPILGVPIKFGKMTRALLGFPKDLQFLIKLLLLNSKQNKQNPLDVEFRNELIEFYSTDLQKLSKILGREFTSWHY